MKSLFEQIRGLSREGLTELSLAVVCPACPEEPCVLIGSSLGEIDSISNGSFLGENVVYFLKC